MRKSDTKGWRDERMMGRNKRLSPLNLLGGNFRNESFPKDCPLRLRIWKMVRILWLSTGCCISMSHTWGILRVDDTGRILLSANHLLWILCPEDCVTSANKWRPEIETLQDRCLHSQHSNEFYAYIIYICIYKDGSWSLFHSLQCLLDHVEISIYNA